MFTPVNGQEVKFVIPTFIGLLSPLVAKVFGACAHGEDGLLLPQDEKLALPIRDWLGQPVFRIQSRIPTFSTYKLKKAFFTSMRRS